MKSLTAFEHCFIGNKTEPDGKGFYKCEGNQGSWYRQPIYCRILLPS